MSHLDDRAKRTATLHAAEKRTLEMIANGANLSDVLNELCAAIDTHSSGTSFVCLMDQAGNQLLPIAGPHLPSAFARAIDRLCKPTLAIQESFGRAADSGRWTGGFRHAGHLRRLPSRTTFDLTGLDPATASITGGWYTYFEN